MVVTRAEYNVAGIEIENTVDADVFDNVATNNRRILVFNMPNLTKKARTRVFQNQVLVTTRELHSWRGGRWCACRVGDFDQF